MGEGLGEEREAIVFQGVEVPVSLLFSLSLDDCECPLRPPLCPADKGFAPEHD